MPDRRFRAALIASPEIADRPDAERPQMRGVRIAQQRHRPRPKKRPPTNHAPIRRRIATKVAQVECALQWQAALISDQGAGVRHGRSPSPTGGTAIVSIRVSTSLISL